MCRAYRHADGFGIRCIRNLLTHTSFTGPVIDGNIVEVNRKLIQRGLEGDSAGAQSHARTPDCRPSPAPHVASYLKGVRTPAPTR
jgi:hypothetical protein